MVPRGPPTPLSAAAAVAAAVEQLRAGAGQRPRRFGLLDAMGLREGELAELETRLREGGLATVVSTVWARGGGPAGHNTALRERRAVAVDSSVVVVLHAPAALRADVTGMDLPALDALLLLGRPPDTMQALYRAMRLSSDRGNRPLLAHTIVWRGEGADSDLRED